MAEANRSIPQIHTVRITTAAQALAQIKARQHVKEEIAHQGEKVTHYAARDITAPCAGISQRASERAIAASDRDD